MLTAEFVLLGYFLDEILLSIDPEGAPELMLESIFLYYFLLTFLSRFFMQNLPTAEIGQFLHLPIKRSKIAMYVQLRSLSTFFNFIPFILFLPFAIKFMSHEYSSITALVWFGAIFFFDMTSNFSLLWLKRKSTNNSLIFFIIIGIIVMAFLLENMKLYSLSDLSKSYFEALQNNFSLILIPIGLSIISFILSYKYIIKNSYLEDLPSTKNASESISSKFTIIGNYGKVGQLVLNEIKLLLRHKRSKSILYMTPMFLLYGLLFYPQDLYRNSFGWLVFVGIFVTGGFMMAYGQYILSWESRHFDFLQSSNISRKDFFTAKYYLIATPTLLMFILTTPYVYFGKDILLINTVAFIYNIGINAPLLLFTASFNRKRMELAKGASMNYQGIGINNFIAAVPLIAFPAIIFKILMIFFNVNTSLLIFTIIGISGFLSHKILIKYAVKFFEKNRYKISEGFRQS